MTVFDIFNANAFSNNVAFLQQSPRSPCNVVGYTLCVFTSVKRLFIHFTSYFQSTFNHKKLHISLTNSMKVKKSHLSGVRITCTPANFDQFLRSSKSQSYPESTVLPSRHLIRTTFFVHRPSRHSVRATFFELDHLRLLIRATFFEIPIRNFRDF